MLYICATPLGNLGDITLRTLEVLKSVDLILAEDTRQSRKLLNHYDIKTPMQSFHAHNEKGKTQEVVERLQLGETMALISDAGSPLISDPGAPLIEALDQAELELCVIPGPSAVLMAAQYAGGGPFSFLGFLPRQDKAKYELLNAYSGLESTLVCFESPHRLLKTLSLIETHWPERPLMVARELTKRFETQHKGSASALRAEFEATPPRGEITLVLHPLPQKAAEVDAETLAERVLALQAQGLRTKEMVKLLKAEWGLPRNQLYAEIEAVLKGL